MRIYILSFLFITSVVLILKGQTTNSEFGYPDIPDTGSSSSEPVILTGGVFEVSPTGSAQYTIPIEAPQGIGGLQPTIALSYNSQGGNGVAGWGFNISGLSAITRGPKNTFYDGSEKGLTFDTGDAYFLNGKRLILSSGSDLQEGAVYYPEDDPQTTITAHGTYNSTIATTWFEVKHSNGIKYCYGKNPSARQSYINGKNNPRIYSWYLDYVEDAPENYIEYSYSIDSHFMYLMTVTYGKNINDQNIGATHTINFQYSSRSDTVPFQLEGIKGNMNNRLTSVSTKTGNIVYRTYNLAYNTTGDATDTKYSRLTHVTIKNGAGEASKPIQFTWTFRPSFSQTMNLVRVDAAQTYPSMAFTEQQFTSGDFNGDGLTDLLGIAPVKIPTGTNSWTYDTYAYIYYASLNSSGNPQFITGKKYSLGPDFTMGDWKEHRGGSSALDFDGDGINEFIVPHLSVNAHWQELGFYVYGSTVNGVCPYNLQRSGEMPVYAIGDINRDGKGDIVFIEKGHSNNYYPGEIIAHNSGNALYRASLNLNLSSKPQKMFLSDYDGDGLQDLMIFHESGYTIYWNQGNGVASSTFSENRKTTGTNMASTPYTMVRSGDFNGDGLADFVINETNNQTWYLAVNQGNGTFTKVSGATIQAYDQSSTSKDDDKFECIVLDFDNDGKDDLFISKTMYSPTKTYSYWMRSTGSDFIRVSGATSNRDSDGLAYRYMAGDFNGDGLPDLINYGHNCYYANNADIDPSWRIYTWGYMSGSTTAGIGKIRTITEGAGNQISINYASMANNSFYTKGNGSAYPVVDLTVPLHGVLSIANTNGAAGTEAINYRYKGLKAHIAGKGLLGMTSFSVNNTTLGIASESGITSWNTAFYIPSSTWSKTTVDGKTAETNVTLAITDKGNKKYFARPSVKTEKDLDGNTVTTTYKFNTTGGYMTEEKADFGSNMYKIVEYQDYIKVGNAYRPQAIIRKQKHADDAAVYTNKTAFTYDTGKGYPLKVIKNQGTNLPLTVDYTYDSAGNIESTKESGSGITSITKYREYDPSGRFIIKAYTSPVSTTQRYTYDTWGNVLTEKNESIASNILTTSHFYDDWGNLSYSLFPDGRKKTVTRGWDNPQSKRYYILTQGTGEPWVKTWYDAKGREVVIESIGEKSQTIKMTSIYNNQGLVVLKVVQTGNLNTNDSYTYDPRGRLDSSSSSAGQSATYTYGNRTVTTVTDGKTYAKTFDAWGNIKSATDPVSSVSYTYYSLGKPRAIVAANATSYMTYDDAGNQTGLTDPNTGSLTCVYDAAGRLTKQTDSKGIITSHTYDDILGRLSKSTVGGIFTNYTYGTSGYDYLLLTKEETGNNYRSYSHDKYGRVISENRQIEGQSLLKFSYTYNDKGEMSRLVYPGGVQANNHYDAYGNLTEVLIGTQPVWELSGATGTVRTTLLGGALTSSVTHNSQGLLANMKTTKGSATVHDMAFAFDGATGNLTSRTGMIAQTESFDYDDINRLTGVKNGTANVMLMDYTPNGNISTKTGLGKYTYGGKPHAAASVENTDLLIPNTDQQITYTAFHKADTVRENNYLLDFTYGPDRQRWKTVLKKHNVIQRTIIYAGNYETITEIGLRREISYINGPDGVVAIHVKQSGQVDKIYYPHYDHLGSVMKITDSNAAEVFKASYDAWGKRTVTRNTFAWHRGFTGHEHLDEFRLIDMNGRMYDPVLGRFLSPDPFVQMPDMSQNYNRYSYVLNNPLIYTDPTGEFIFSALLTGIGSIIDAICWGAVIGAGTSVVSYSVGAAISGNWSWNGFGNAVGMGAVGGSIGGGIGAIGGLMGSFGNSLGYNILSQASSNALTNTIFGNDLTWGGVAGSLAGGLVGFALPNFNAVKGGALKNAMAEIGFNSGRGTVTGIASGLVQAGIDDNPNAIWQNALGGAINGASTSILNIALLGPAYKPHDTYYSHDREGQSTYRKGGLLLRDGEGIAIGHSLGISGEGKRLVETEVHESTHLWQQRKMGWANFYGETIKSYVSDFFKYGNIYHIYERKGTLEWQADKAARHYIWNIY